MIQISFSFILFLFVQLFYLQDKIGFYGSHKIVLFKTQIWSTQNLITVRSSWNSFLTFFSLLMRACGVLLLVHDWSVQFWFHYISSESVSIEVQLIILEFIWRRIILRNCFDNSSVALFVMKINNSKYIWLSHVLFSSYICFKRNNLFIVQFNELQMKTKIRKTWKGNGILLNKK